METVPPWVPFSRPEVCEWRPSKLTTHCPEERADISSKPVLVVATGTPICERPQSIQSVSSAISAHSSSSAPHRFCSRPLVRLLIEPMRAGLPIDLDTPPERRHSLASFGIDDDPPAIGKMAAWPRRAPPLPSRRIPIASRPGGSLLGRAQGARRPCSRREFRC